MIFISVVFLKPHCAEGYVVLAGLSPQKYSVLTYRSDLSHGHGRGGDVHKIICERGDAERDGIRVS